MADGEFSQALEQLNGLLQQFPDDPEIRSLEYSCCEMVRLQAVSAEMPGTKNEISVKEYVAVHFRKFMRKLCCTLIEVLHKLPHNRCFAAVSGKFQVSTTVIKLVPLLIMVVVINGTTNSLQ